MAKSPEATHPSVRIPMAESERASRLSRALRILSDEHKLALDAASEAGDPRRRLSLLRSLYLEKKRLAEAETKGRNDAVEPTSPSTRVGMLSRAT